MQVEMNRIGNTTNKWNKINAMKWKKNLESNQNTERKREKELDKKNGINNTRLPILCVFLFIVVHIEENT